MAVARNTEMRGGDAERPAGRPHISMQKFERRAEEITQLFVFRKMRARELSYRIRAEPNVMLHPHFDACVREGLTATE